MDHAPADSKRPDETNGCGLYLEPAIKKIVGVGETRKCAAKKYYFVFLVGGFSVGNFALVQARQPPSIEMQFE